eukprot:6209655-Prorocentrum_lima.AAC.1
MTAASAAAPASPAPRPPALPKPPPSLPRPPPSRPPPAESMDFFVRIGRRPPTSTSSTDAEWHLLP